MISYNDNNTWDLLSGFLDTQIDFLVAITWKWWLFRYWRFIESSPHLPDEEVHEEAQLNIFGNRSGHWRQYFTLFSASSQHLSANCYNGLFLHSARLFLSLCHVNLRIYWINSNLQTYFSILFSALLASCSVFCGQNASVFICLLVSHSSFDVFLFRHRCPYQPGHGRGNRRHGNGFLGSSPGRNWRLHVELHDRGRLQRRDPCWTRPHLVQADWPEARSSPHRLHLGLQGRQSQQEELNRGRDR